MQLQPGPSDVPVACYRCQQTTLHRPGPDGQYHCLRCLTLGTSAPPMAQQVGAPQQRAPVVTEQTSKQWKAGIFIGGLVFFGGCMGTLATAGNSGAAIGVMLVGVIVYLASRFGAWWHHG